MGISLVTRAEYKAYAGIASTTDDAKIDVLIPKVSALVKSLCRRTFLDYVNDSKVEYHEGGTKILLPYEIPILSITSLEYSLDYGSTYTALVEYTDYTHRKSDDTIVCIGQDFPYYANGYKLTYTAGYETLPEDLKIAVLDLIQYYMKHDTAIHSNKAPGTNTVQIEYVLSTALPAHIKRVLDLYTAEFS